MNITHRIYFLLAILGGSAAMAQNEQHIPTAQPQYDQYSEELPYCQILDRVVDPVWQTTIGYYTRENIRGGSDFGIMEFDASSGLAFYRTRYGEVDIKSGVDLNVIVGSDGVGLPNQFGSIHMDVAWTIRQPDGFSLRLSAFPGLYSDFEDLSAEDFFIPMDISAIWAFHERASGLLGVAIFPDFDQTMEPRAGIRWAMSDFATMDIFFPESRLRLTPNEFYAINMGVSINKYAEYQLDEGNPRDRLMLDETRFFLGMEFSQSDATRFLIEVGRIVNRDIDFEEVGSRAHVDDGFYLRVGLTGAL